MHHDQIDRQVLASLDRGGGETLREANPVLWRQLLQVQIRRLVVNATLGFRTDLTEEGDGLDGVLTGRGLIV